MTTESLGHYASIHGQQVYYESEGAGHPLVMVHGGFGVAGIFEPLREALSGLRQLITVELQGHGHTADIDRPLTFEALADDIAALLVHLGLPTADVLGYSMGGGVALQTAIRHSDHISRLLVVSAPCTSQGWYPEVFAGMGAVNAQLAQTFVGTPMHQAYLQAAPHPEHWGRLADKTGQMLGRAYDWSEAVARLRCPTLLALGDADSLRPAHAAEFFGLLGGGQKDGNWDGSGLSQAQLAILPAITHYNILSSPALAAAIRQFLERPLPR